MHIEEFKENDVLVNVHGYKKWDDGLVEQAVNEITSKFPGEIYGVIEEGFEDEIYGREHIDEENLLETRPKSGYFKRRNLDIEDADHIVITGGNLGQCHKDSYKIFRDKVDKDTDIIIPPEACFGYESNSAPVELLYKLENLQKGELDRVEEQQDYFIEEIAEKVEFGKYDWEQTSIQPIELSTGNEISASSYQSDSNAYSHLP